MRDHHQHIKQSEVLREQKTIISMKCTLLEDKQIKSVLLKASDSKMQKTNFNVLFSEKINT